MSKSLSTLLLSDPKHKLAMAVDAIAVALQNKHEELLNAILEWKLKDKPDL